MTTDYAGSGAFPATITIPSDGDPWNSSLISQPMQQLADRTSGLILAAPGLAPASYIQSPLGGAKVSAEWENVLFSLRQLTTGTSGESVLIPLTLPTYGELSEVHVMVTGGSHAAIPVSLPNAAVYRGHVVAGTYTYTVVQSQVDISDLTQYQASHEIVVAGLTEWLIYPTSQFYLFLSGEYGANSLDNSLIVNGVYSKVSPRS